MGVYIKGLEMPKDDCEAYRQIIITNNLVDGKIQMLAHDANTNEFIGEVVELPPHGRLIDADTLKKILVTAIPQYSLAGCTTYADSDIMRWIDEAPTVIPAEEG